jgi:SAM-dependent methyltransferase
MEDLYDNAYYPNNVYGHVKALLERTGVRPGELHLDFGCGFGRIAEPLRAELSLTYLGFDADPRALASLKSRDFECHPANLRDLNRLKEVVAGALRGRRVASLSIIDTLEHLPEPEEMLAFLHSLGLEHNAPLVVSIPNVAHRDVGFKLAFGRWDRTPAGLLDRTHLQFFTEQKLEAIMLASGWHETSRHDLLLEESDQHFPGFHPALAAATPLNRLLRGLRDSVDGTGSTNQFVRAYLAGPRKEVSELSANPPTPGPFLSVVTRTQGRRPDTLRDVFLCLSAQTSQDFEIIVVGHKLDVARQIGVEQVIEEVNPELRSRIRLHLVDHGDRAVPLNEGFEQARGDYVAILDDDDFVFAHWVETFRSLAESFPGQVLRAATVSQLFERVKTQEGKTSVRAVGGFERPYAPEFDLFAHLIENQSPAMSLAFPRAAFAELKIRFDEQLTTTEDWDFLMRTAVLCGVASSPAVTSVYRRWQEEESSYTLHRPEEWRSNYDHIRRKLDRMPFVLPPGAASRLQALLTQSRAAAPATALLAREPHEMRQRIAVILNSRSWKLTSPLRRLSRLFGGGPEPTRNLTDLGNEELDRMARGLEESNSWRITQPLRSFRNRFRK